MTFLRSALVALLVCLLPQAARAQFGGDDGGPPDYVAVKSFLDKDAYRPGETARAAIEFKIDPRVHINSDKPTADYQFPSSIEWTEEQGLTISRASWPKALMKAFEFTEGQKIAVFEGTQRATLTIKIPGDAAPGARSVAGAFKAQGCTHTTCYAPQTDELKLLVRVVAAGEPTAAVNEDKFPAPAAGGAVAGPAEPADGAVAAEPVATGAEDRTATAAEAEAATVAAAGSDDVAASTATTEASPTAAAPPGGVPSPHDDSAPSQCPTEEAEALPSDRPLAIVFILTFLGGLALAFTPCVLPLVPITIGFFSRQQEGGKRPVVPAMLYVLGLALVYSALGTVAALSGGLFGAMMQKPVVVLAIAATLFSLALSMFGLWDLNMPAFVTNRIGGGRAGNLGAMAMGAAMGLVAAPCVGPLVVSLLTYVAALGSRMDKLPAAALGSALFFALALGMGLPFFLVALGAGSLRPGEWMVSVKKVFGFIILGLVLFFLRPLVGAMAFQWGLVVLLLAAGVYFLAHSRAEQHGPRARMAVAAVGALSLVGMLAWAGLTLKGMGAGEGKTHSFVAYSEDALERARADRRPVVVDFGAEWCIACKELEHKTFPDAQVQAKLKEFVALKADLTDDTPANKAIWKKWNILGLPTIIFLDSNGEEIRPLRLKGFEAPAPFVERLDCAGKIDVASN